MLIQEARLYLFGSFQLQYHGVPLAVSLVRSQALLAYLAYNVQPVTRQRLVGLLWPDRDEQDARRQLTYAIYHLNKILREHDDRELLVNVGADRVQINPQLNGKWWIDALAFRQSAEHIMHCPAVPTHTNKLEADLLLHRHEFLAGFPLTDSDVFEDWMINVRNSLAMAAQKAGLHLSQLYFDAHRFADALRIAEYVVGVDALNESAHRRLMEIQCAMGERAAALQQYETCRQLLMDELDASPCDETLALYQSILNDHVPVRNSTRKTAQKRAVEISDSMLVGREAEIGAIQQAIDQAQGGDTAWIALYGASGIGKSVLLNRTVELGREAGLRVVQSLCQEMTLDVTYLPIIEALRPIVKNKMLDGQPIWQFALEHLLPELSEHQGEVPSYSPHKQLLLINALITLLETITRQQTTLWVLDDVQWSDYPTQQFLIHLLKYTDLPLLVIFSFRDDPIEPGFEEFFDTIFHSPKVQKLQIKALTHVDVQELLRFFVQSDVNIMPLVKRLMAETRGNPLYLMEYLRAVNDTYSGILTADDISSYLDAFQQGNLPLPNNLRDFIQRRLRRLDPTAKEVLEAAAVYGFQFDIMQLQAIMPHADQEFIHAIEAAEEQYFIKPIHLGRYEFTHPVIHRTILSGISYVRSSWLHREIALEIERSMPRADERADILAQHYLLGCIPEKALEYFLLAAQRAMGLYAVEQAIKFYEQALGLASEAFSVEQTIGLLLDLADALKNKGDQRAVIQRCHAAQALTVNREVNPDLIARTHLLLAESYALLREYDESLAELSHILDQDEGSAASSPFYVNALVLKVRVLQGAGTSTAALNTLLDRAVQILRADPSPNQRGLAHLLLQKGHLAFRRGMIRDSIEHIYQSIHSLPKVDFDPLSSIMLHNTIAYFLLHDGKWYEANRYALNALDVAHRSHNPEYIARVLHTKGEVHSYRAEWHEARKIFFEAVEIAQDNHLNRELCLSLSGLGGIELSQHQPQKALTFLEGALEYIPTECERWLAVTIYLQAARANIEIHNLAIAQQFIDIATQLIYEGDLILLRVSSEVVQACLWAEQGKSQKAIEQLLACGDFYIRTSNQLKMAEVNLLLSRIYSDSFPQKQRFLLADARDTYTALGARFALEMIERHMNISMC